MGALLLIGRIFFSLIFLSSGINHIVKVKDMTGYAKHKKMPFPGFSVFASGVLFIAGAVFIILGVWVDLGALLIGVTTFLAGVIFHNFWAADEASKQNEMIQFMKNISITGAALIIVAVLNIKHGVDFGPSINHGAQILFHKN